ncbi:MAG TPA: glycosyltransferase family 87 protein [Bradyrhizobium sp.]|nr:glycosyltransferase family 87 protein [Bradyrhizobium sp.]
MPQTWHAFRSGSWLTPARARGYSLILLAIALLGIVTWIALSNGLVDRNDKPLGTDFSSFYTAGELALEGKASSAYSAAAHHALQQQMFGANTPYYAWLYPPSFFLAAAPLALLPYPLALALWQGSTLVSYLLVIAAILQRPRRQSPEIAKLWLPVAAAFPAAFINLGHGQNGFLSAALFGAALLCLARRPIIAGILLGALSYKPQLALVIPFALLAAGQWRTMIAGGMAVILLAAASALLFGSDAWWAFIASTDVSRKLLLEEGSVGFEKLQSAFAAVRMWGGSIGLAYAVQGAVAAAAICATARVWYLDQSREVKAALLLAGTTLASPHILDYDLMLLAPAMAFFIANRSSSQFRNYEISLLAAVWTAPLLARTVAGLVALPVGFLANLVLFVLIVRDQTGLLPSPHALADLRSRTVDTDEATRAPGIVTKAGAA